ncbi:hypothetical protein C8R48DRAFT_604500 [Suillus tomentosus]|nr:hypothetical protein C8R48DRAFT_604500 [Suillus tomentosus]
MYTSFHNIWEFWFVENPLFPTLFYILLRAYNIAFSIFQAPYYALSQTMMAEPDSDNMVYLPLSSLTRRKWFSFLFALCMATSVIWFDVDATKAHRDAVRWAAD